MQTLSRALQALGGEAPLAKALGVPALALSRWLTGREAVPASIYLRARTLVPPGR
jgi:DNA-binding transcriptional regulator YdaS (Cro superfamily)